MPWEIAILVGGGFALADGCEVMQFIEDTEQIICISSNSDMKWIHSYSLALASHSVAVLKRINVTNIQDVQKAGLQKKKFLMSSKTRKTVSDDYYFLFNLYLMEQELWRHTVSKALIALR